MSSPIAMLAILKKRRKRKKSAKGSRGKIPRPAVCGCRYCGGQVKNPARL